MVKSIIIMGSARSDGDTAKIVKEILSVAQFDMIDLNDYSISSYDYEHKNRNDDFIPLLKRISKYQTIIFATPVYWYSMSSILKVFFDRLSDLLTIEKDLGRSFRGKSMAAISSSVGNNLGDDFWHPFINTARYLGMNYLGDSHFILKDDEITAAHKKQIEEFVEKLK